MTYEVKLLASVVVTVRSEVNEENAGERAKNDLHEAIAKQISEVEIDEIELEEVTEIENG